jgi:hypothetical protein
MKRTILAALFVGAATTMAAADVVVVYDVALGEKFETKREIVDRVQEEFGKYAAFDSADELPPSIDKEIVPGEPLPENAPVEEVPDELGDLPTLGEDTLWIATGNHLVEVTDDNQVVMVVYEALP